jgi:hypothetical protein
MKIRYYLLDNPMTPDPNDRMAQITDYEVITEKELLAYITRQGASITMSEAKANYEEIIGVHEYFLRQGVGINTEFLNIRPVVQGVFLIPANLPSDEYTLEARVLPKGNKELKKGILPDKLNI